MLPSGGAVGGGLVGAEGEAANSVGAEIANAALDSAASQEANIALGLQKGFSWAAVAASAVAAPLAKAAGDEITGPNPSAATEEERIAGNLAQGAIDETTYAAFTGGKINYAQVTADAFGNAIGNSIVQAEAGPQYGLTQGQQQDELAQIAAGAKTSMDAFDTQLQVETGSQLAMQQISAQVAAGNQTYFAQQESDFNAAQGLRDLAIDSEYSIQTQLNQSLQNSLANLRVPQVNFSVDNGTTDQVDYNPYTFYGDLQMRKQLESQGLSADRVNAQMAAYENPSATTGSSSSSISPDNPLYQTPLEALLANPPPKGPFIGPIDYTSQARLQEQQNVLGAVFLGGVLGGGTYFLSRDLGASDPEAARLATAQSGLVVGTSAVAPEAESVELAASEALGNGSAAPLEQATIDEILSTPKGFRPDPSTYLSQDYIDLHLAQFNSGATRFAPESTFNKYGLGQSDGTAFVIPSSEADQLLVTAGTDTAVLEDALGLPSGYLQSNTLLRIDIQNPLDLNLKIPSGNEAGANDFWIPGGKLPTGGSEAVVDVGGATPPKYTATPLYFGPPGT